MGSSKKQITGYEYYMGWHDVLLMAPITEIHAMRWAKKHVVTLLGFTVSESSRRNLFLTDHEGFGPDTPHFKNLFGGHKKEGGVQGKISFYFGDHEEAPEYLEELHGVGNVPFYKNVVSAIFERFYYAANNPYIKPYSFEMSALHEGWYPEKANVGGFANGAHIFYAAMTSNTFGKGEYPSALDLDALTEVADRLHAENFGVTFLWVDGSTVDEFLTRVMNHVGAVRYEHPTTGKWVMKLLRDDYDIETVPELNESNIVSVDGIQKTAPFEAVNTITIEFHDRSISGGTCADQIQKITVENLGAIQAQGAVVKQTLNYHGLPTSDLAARVGMRELKLRAKDLARINITLNRAAYNFTPGMVVKFSYAKEGIVNMPLRILEVKYNDILSGKIILVAAQDAVGTPTQSYVVEQPSQWVEQDGTPLDLNKVLLIETPYYIVATTVSQADINARTDDATFVSMLAARDTGLWQNYEMHVDDGSGYQYQASAAFSAYTILDADIDALPTTVLIDFTAGRDLQFIPMNSFVLIGDEMMFMTAIDLDINQMTVVRGVLDTIPQKHTAGARVWAPGDAWGFDETERFEAEAIDYRLLPTTGDQTLLLDDATPREITLVNRYDRPYPPGNVQINGQYFPETFTGDIAITWAHRDRTMQTSPVPEGWGTGNIGPEPGVTYNVRIYDDDTNNLLKESVNQAPNTFTYTEVQEVIDHVATVTNYRFEVESERDGFACMKLFVFVLGRI